MCHYVPRGLNGYRNKSHHRKLTLEKKILPPALPGLEPETFRSRVYRSTTELSSLPKSDTLFTRVRQCMFEENGENTNLQRQALKR